MGVLEGKHGAKINTGPKCRPDEHETMVTRFKQTDK